MHKIKTKSSSTSNSYPKSIVHVNGNDLKNTETFKYLGTKIQFNDSGIGAKEIANRKIQANLAFDENKKLFKNFKINLNTRVKLLNSLVRSRLTYNCQIWPLTESQIKTLNATYVHFLRQLLRHGQTKIDDTHKPKIKNDEVYKLTNCEALSKYITCLQEKFIANIITTDNQNTNKKLLFNDEKQTKPGRPGPKLFSQVCQSQNKNEKEFCVNAIMKKKII